MKAATEHAESGLACAPYHYAECGLDDVYLLNGFEYHATAYGLGVSIHDVDGLHRTIALDLVRGKRLLSGREIRFLRKEMDLSQEGLAMLLGNSAQTVARWEKGQTEVPGSADRLIRLLYLEQVAGEPQVRELLEVLSHLDVLAHEQRLFEERDGWRPAA